MIHFACPQCGSKFKVKDEFAGRSTKCAACKFPLRVPEAPRVEKLNVAGKMDGPASSLYQAGIDPGVTLPYSVAPPQPAAATGPPSGPSSPSGRSSGSTSGSNTAAAAPGPAPKPVAEVLRGAERVVGRYLLEGEIARGGMGVVLRGIDRDIRREVALKIMLDDQNARQKARFVEEAQITGQLEHPNIVPVHELGVAADNRLFFTMKMVRGRSLSQVLDALRNRKDASRQWTLPKLLNVLVNVCHAVGYAHSRRVVHRDLKPANIMVGDFGEVYVMDWGLAKVVAVPPGQRQAGPPSIQAPPNVQAPPPNFQAPPPPPGTYAATPPPFVRAGAPPLPPPAPTPPAPPLSAQSPAPGSSSAAEPLVQTNRDPDSELTEDGAIIGTPAYMPPEQACGRLDEIDERSDIYSLGGILYALLTLETPVEKGGDYMALLMRVVEGKVIKPEERVPERARRGFIPAELSAIAMKALAKAPADRYQTVEAFRRDLELFQEGRSVSAKRDTIWEMTRKFARRHKGLSAGIVLALLVLVGSFGFLLNAWAETRATHLAFKKEQFDKEARTKMAVPAFIDAARQAVHQLQFDTALTHVDVALDYDPDSAEGRLLKGQLLVARKEFDRAAVELDLYLALRPDDAHAEKLAKLCKGPDTSVPGVQADMGNLLVLQKQPTLALGLFQGNEKRVEIYRKQIEAAWPGMGAQLRLDKDFKFALSISFNIKIPERFIDLSPLRGIPLSSLTLSSVKTRDLGPLEGMPLTSLDLLYLPNLNDLSPLKGMPLTSLKILQCPEVEGLAPLQGMPLTSLQIEGCPRVKDVTPLRGMPLTKLILKTTQVTDISSLKGMPLRELTVAAADVKEIEALRGMPLQSLTLTGNRKLKDISPLKGTKLEQLDIGSTDVADLGALAGMPLAVLNCPHTQVKDLTPLRGMPLNSLFLYVTKVRDLTPLDGLSLEIIQLPNPVKGLTGLEVLRRMESLRRISFTTSIVGVPPEEFWEKLEAGDIK